MKTYSLDYSGANEYRNDLYKYYNGQCYKGRWNGIGGCNGWISHFCIDLSTHLYKDVPFLRALFSFEPYVIGRILLYDSEGYLHAMEKINKRAQEQASPKLTDVFCYYTGGGIYNYSAKYNDEVWLFTDFELTGSFDRPYERDGSWGKEPDPEAKEKEPSVPYPTWHEIINSLKQPDATILGFANEVIDIIKEYHPNLRVRMNEID